MGCGNLFFTLVITFSVALITYNIIISANAPLKQDFPGPSDRKSSNGVVFPKDPIIKMPVDRKLGPTDVKKKRLFHTAVTASDGVYNTWQSRIMYYWFKKFKDGPNSDMGGFTRILHSGKPDNLMDEIPTFIAQPLKDGMDQAFSLVKKHRTKLKPFAVIGSDMSGFTRILHSGKPDNLMDEIPTFIAQPLKDGMDQGYIVLNRPWAFVQWLQQANIEEDYILMAEPDHIIVKPIPNLSKDGLGAAFPFFYIEPKKQEHILRKFFPEEKGPITNIDPIGNSPVIVGKEALKKIAPTWMNVSLAMKKDPDADKAFGWVLEMYAYAVSSALHGVGNILYKDFMLQPPWDTEIGNKYIIHYTYGCDYDMQGKLTYGKIGEWRFDKRSYTTSWPPRNLPLPPPGVPESVVTLVNMVNEATANIPNWGE